MKNQMSDTKLSSKHQTTVPSEVRKVLDVTNGDGLRWIIKGDEVVIKKISKIDLDWAKSVEMTLQEWNSKEDDEAFSDL